MPNALARQRCPDCGGKLIDRRHREKGCPATGVKSPAKPEPLRPNDSQPELGNPDLWRGGY